MKNNYEQEYAIYAEISKRYDESGYDPEVGEICRAEHKALMDSIEAKGAAYARGFRYYDEMKFRENDYIVIDECIFENKAEEFIEELRECGIEEFVFASTWTSSMEVMWQFTQCGCRLGGMVEVNGAYKSFSTDKWEKKHGILITL